MKRWVAALGVLCLMSATAMPAVAAGGKGTTAEAEPAHRAMHADLDGNKLFDNLEEQLTTLRDTDPVDVIVQLALPADEAMIARAAEVAEGLVVKSRWDQALQGFSATVEAGRVPALARLPFVASVEPDLKAEAFLNGATAWSGVQQARSDYGLDGDRNGNPGVYTAEDVVVAVIDTGIDPGHVDLDGGKLLAFRDEVNGRTAAYDDNGHGTHVASILAGTGEGNPQYRGVAPGAALVGIKVLGRTGSGTTSDIIDGINWMINNRQTYNIRIANMSLGASGCSSGTDSLSIAVTNASNAGIAMFVAAGNSGPGRCTIGAPAAAAQAVTVGSAIDPGEGGWGVSPFSSRGPTADGRLKPDILAPGTNVTAARSGSRTGYITYSGTSMATPFAAGVGALLLDANPNLTVANLKAILYANGADWGPSGQDVDYGRGLLQAYGAIKQAAGGSGSFSDGLAHVYQSGSFSGAGQSVSYSVAVTDTSKPIALTLIMTNWSGSARPDYDLYLIGPSGATVARAEGTTRQEQILYQPLQTGTYRVRVYAYAGSGPWFFDLSYR